MLGDIGQGMGVGQSSSILCGRPNLCAVSLGLHEAFMETTVLYVNFSALKGPSLLTRPERR